MKKILIVTCLFIISFFNSYGQWYNKKYHVSDINLLTKEQLDESLSNSKNGLLISGFVAGIGGVAFLITRYMPQPIEDPTFIEQLIGDEGMNTIYQGISAGLFVGGTIAIMAYLGRNARIKATIKKNYPKLGSLNISPTLLLNNHKVFYHPGITLTYNF
jgi:hypothetical protein